MCPHLHVHCTRQFGHTALCYHGSFEHAGNCLTESTHGSVSVIFTDDYTGLEAIEIITTSVDIGTWLNY